MKTKTRTEPPVKSTKGDDTPKELATAEIQGLNGPFTFPEKLLQQIWQRRDFDTRKIATTDGRPIAIINPGKWNRLAGPDFKAAHLRIGDEELHGDVEVHLREADWHLHQHSRNPSFENVVLHVVLFSAQHNTATPPPPIDKNKSTIPVLTLLPHLHHDLEQYAADAAIERLAEHALTRANKTLTALPQAELRETLARHAMLRWRQKVHFARIRIQRLKWADACHHAALEVLGYSKNRVPMLTIAENFPLEHWHVHSQRNAEQIADDIYTHQTQNGGWMAQATRPANNPHTRLRQYAAWVAARLTWPDNMLHLTAQSDSQNAAEEAALTVASWRRKHNATTLRALVAKEVCSDTITGTRLDTLICDAFLPLLAAQIPAREETLGVMWKNWFMGDAPEHYAKLLHALEITGSHETPAHNGAAQGLLGYLIEAEREM